MILSDDPHEVFRKKTEPKMYLTNFENMCFRDQYVISIKTELSQDRRLRATDPTLRACLRPGTAQRREQESWRNSMEKLPGDVFAEPSANPIPADGAPTHCIVTDFLRLQVDTRG
jgi:hypothetical protein